MDENKSYEELLGKYYDLQVEIEKLKQAFLSYDKEWDRNWKQHAEFYADINKLSSENDSVSGGVKVLGAIMVPIFVSVIIALIRSFI